MFIAAGANRNVKPPLKATIVVFFAILFYACAPIAPIPPAPSLAPPHTVSATIPTVAPSRPPSALTTALPPMPEPAPRLMYVQWLDDGVMYVPAHTYDPAQPPVAFAASDGSPISPPSWASNLARVSGIYLTWSSDGHFIAFDGFPLDEEGLVQDSHSASETSLLVADTSSRSLLPVAGQTFRFYARGGGPTFSPDGTQLAVPLGSPSTMWQSALYVLRPGIAEPRMVAPPIALFPSWSPVDNSVAYLEVAAERGSCGPFFPDDSSGCDQATLKLFHIDTDSISTLLEGVHIGAEAGRENWYNAPAWSPDGRWLAVFQGSDSPDLITIDTAAQNRSTLARGVDRGSYLSFSPTGDTIAYVSRQTGNDEIMLLGLDSTAFPVQSVGPPRNITNHPGADQWPVWSPDGKFLAFLSDRPNPGTGQYHLYVVDLATQQLTQVAEGLVLGRPAWVPPSAPP